jgi:HAD superfamily hydrolase (TIGR01484 family)
MTPLALAPRTALSQIEFVFTDVDETLTTHGRLTANVLGAMEAMQLAGINVVPVTGRPAGWCHGLPRLWPIAGVIAENGSVAYWIDANDVQQELHRYADADERARTQARLLDIQRKLLQKHTTFCAAQDQYLRTADIAFDHAENVPQVPAAQIEALVADLKAHGLATAVSSIHAHGTFGEANKLTMTRAFVQTAWSLPLESLFDRAVFVGDSLNDAPMFAAFPFSVGVANVRNVLAHLPRPPAYVTHASEGEGFVELARAILAAKSPL